jgi:hypothetical protein
VCCQQLKNKKNKSAFWRLTLSIYTMQVEVFKTNVDTKQNAERIIENIKGLLPVGRINFDLDDRDKILRIEAKEIQVQPIQNLLLDLGYTCSLLE